MRHEHLVVTVEAEVKERVEEDLEPGESLEAWVADAVERKLDEQEADDGNGRGDAGAGTERREPRRERRERTADGRFGDRSDDGRVGDGSDDKRVGDDEYDEGFEFVDDCSI